MKKTKVQRPPEVFQFFLPHMTFAEEQLTLRYRANAKAQTLRIEVDGPWPPDEPSGDAGPRILGLLGAATRAGLCGGEEFDPCLGEFRVLAGPMCGERSALPDACDYRWTVEVAGVNTLSLRLWIEWLSSSFAAVPGLAPGARRVLIEGSLPVNKTAASITEKVMRMWLESGRAYPNRWKKGAFPVIEAHGQQAARIEAFAAGTLSPSHAAAFEERCALVLRYAAMVADRDHKRPGSCGAPRFEHAPGRLALVSDPFDFDPYTARALFTGMLTRFHREVALLERIELTLP